MGEKSTIKAIRGFKDILPADMPWWGRIEDSAKRILSNFGYREMRIPVVEQTPLFARSIGEDTDIVEKEMFTFPDRHDALLTLRPEATAGIVRAVIEHSLAKDGQPLKLFFIGPMFRYERPQKGRQRQFHQLDVEVFNDPSPLRDAEIIALLQMFLDDLGLPNISMNINSLGCPNCRPDFKARLKGHLAGRQEELCPDCRRRMDANPLRVIDCKVPECREVVRDAPLIIDTICPDCRDHFSHVQAGLDRAGVPFVVNPRLVRGLDYYTRTTFEALTGDLGAQNAVAGGGRYDGLVKALGGSDVPGAGFAAGLERLAMILAQGDLPPADTPDLYVAALDESAVTEGFGLVQALRREGLKVETDYVPGSLKSRMKRANKLGAGHVLILGPDELARGYGILRNMDTKDQSDVELREAAGRLSTLLKKGEFH